MAKVLPIVGFYLQPSVGGRVLRYSFWRRFAEIENVVAIKIAPFNRYQTIDVIRAIAASGREDITLYTGNDDNIVLDLLTPHVFHGRTLRIKGGLLGTRFVGPADIEALADLPSLEELRGKLLGVLQAPAQKLAALINTPGSQLARVIKAKSEKAAA